MPSKNALDFLLLKLFNYGESDTMKPKIKEAAEILKKTIDDLAGPGVLNNFCEFVYRRSKVGISEKISGVS